MPVPASNFTSVESGDPSKTDAKHPTGSQDEYIYVPDDFKVKEGARLTDQLSVGKPLGVGLQVLVTVTSHVALITRSWTVEQGVFAGRRLLASGQQR